MRLLGFIILYLGLVNGKPVDFIDDPGCAGYDACHPVFSDKLNVHLVPHSHDDVGWLFTVDQYYNRNVQYIISTVVESLLKNPERRFIQVETAYFYMWWNQQTEETKSQVRQLINEGRLEISNGAWSMNDEADVHYQSTIDQYTLGLRFIEDVLGKCGRPKGGWQIDPFGHSREQASLLAQMGMDSLFFARIDYRDRKKRNQEKSTDMLWKGSANLGPSSHIFTSVLYNHYSAPTGFCFDIHCTNTKIITNPKATGYNWERKVKDFANYVHRQSLNYTTNNVLITMGDDFHWQDAEKYFFSLDRLIEGFKKFNPKIDDKEINIIYSTPSCYAKAVRDVVIDQEIKLNVKTDDFFPYADGVNTVWSGFFTSRPTSKRLERFANNLHQVSKQVSALGANPYDIKNQLSQALGVMQHHDAITGTEKTAVEKDYHRQVVSGMNEAISKISSTFSSILGVKDDLKLTSCLLSNVSICKESGQDKFTVLLYNPLARKASHYIQIPVKDGTWTVTDPSGEEVENHLTEPIRDFSYISKHTKNTKILPKVLLFRAEDLPALGYKVYTFERTSFVSSSVKEEVLSVDQVGFEDRYVNFDLNTGLLKSITLNGVSLPIKQEMLFYRSARRVSGAYIFRPDTNLRNAMKFGGVQTSILVNDGNLVREIRQVWKDWVTQIIRIYKEEDFIEFDWVVGPIDLSDRDGKEVITRYSTSLFTDGVFYTDSNGREIIYRKKNYRPTYEYTDEEPQAGNYYPVNSKILIRDDVNEFAVLTDRSEGGASLNSGEVELMLIRATMDDDRRGVNENLNEKEYEQGLVARGSHFVTLGGIAEGDGKRSMAAIERDIAQRKLLQPWVFFTESDIPVKEQSFLNKELPSNIHLLTLESWGSSNTILIRLEHILEKEEDPNLSKEVEVDISDLFKTFKITSMKEYMLAANTPLEESERFEWPQIVEYDDNSSPLNKTSREFRDEADLRVALSPMQIRTFVATVEFVE